MNGLVTYVSYQRPRSLTDGPAPVRRMPLTGPGQGPLVSVVGSLLLAAISVSASAHPAAPDRLRAGQTAQASPVKPIDEMTCQEARNFVAETGRYYLRSRDGVLPIYPIRTIEQGPKCEGSPHSQSPWFEIHATLDNPQCWVGFSCSTKY
jgi:hypothetical protein